MKFKVGDYAKYKREVAEHYGWQVIGITSYDDILEITKEVDGQVNVRAPDYWLKNVVTQKPVRIIANSLDDESSATRNFGDYELELVSVIEVAKFRIKNESR